MKDEKEKTKPYFEGWQTFKQGVDNSNNPYPIGGRSGINPDRYQWFMGWYDAKYERFYRDDYNGRHTTSQ